MVKKIFSFQVWWTKIAVVKLRSQSTLWWSNNCKWFLEKNIRAVAIFWLTTYIAIVYIRMQTVHCTQQQHQQHYRLSSPPLTDIRLITPTTTRVFHFQVTRDVIAGAREHVTARLQPTRARRLASEYSSLPDHYNILIIWIYASACQAANFR